MPLAAGREHCSGVVADFLDSGGSIRNGLVVSGAAAVPLALFANRIGLVRAFHELAAHGCGFDPGEGGRYRLSLPKGLRFECSAALFTHTVAMLWERVVEDEYGWLAVRDRVVIDVGANIADSTLEFASRGAKHVYGFEPDPVMHEAAQLNIGLNSFQNIDLICAAVVGADRSGNAVKGATVTLAEALKVARDAFPDHLIVCKIDCEGCEFDLLTGKGPTIRLRDRVAQLMVEYHDASPEPIVAALERSGFSVAVQPTRPRLGWIRAERTPGPG